MHLNKNAGATLRSRPGRRTAAMAVAAFVAASLVPSASAAASPRPDLATKSVTVTAAAKPGDEISVAASVKNASKGEAPATKTTFALSTDESAGGELSLAAKGTVKGLKPGR